MDFLLPEFYLCLTTSRRLSQAFGVLFLSASISHSHLNSSLSASRSHADCSFQSSISASRRLSQQDVEGGQQPSKNYIRYATRQKRADSKKALKDLLNKSGASKFSFQDDDSMWRPGG
ncbi:uncharacterized protein LOC133779088 [Humulus lupulus]|uniref:uncharacterized protein LOC133779088 n=1 Tax=Humulus lupulus TaxID=3486 RepID=UPI002B410AFC|nr:uncharacterized protein LOC133779088 [Humulus lupulus]